MKNNYLINLGKWMCLFLIVLISGCNINPEPTINQLLTGRNADGKAWHLQTVLINGESSEYPCERDDVYIFKPKSDLEHRGGILTIKPQFLKCYLGEEEEDLDWFYGGSNDKYVYVEIFEDDILQIIQYEITQISENHLELQHIYEFPYGDKTEVTFMEFEYKP